MKIKVFFTMLALLCSANAFSAVISAPQQKIVNLRVEGTAGLIGFSKNPTGTDCVSRYWVDLKDEVEKVKFSIAMMAFSAGKDVVLRADPEKSKMYGACKLYDIIIYE